jgi:hypothetical protein
MQNSAIPEPDAEFYIGYAPSPPKRVAQMVVRAVLGLTALVVPSALILVFAQHPFAKSTFEFQQYREFTGNIELEPYRALLVARPGTNEFSRYLLVAEGKHGADKEVEALRGQKVMLRGSLIYRDGHTMIEVVTGSVKAAGPAPITIPVADLGHVALTGEIVDSKCYLGVMNPGRTKVHRECAARCISGGIPPALVTEDGLYLLTGADGTPLNREVIDFVGETVEVSGNLVRSGDTLILRANPTGFRRIKIGRTPNN